MLKRIRALLLVLLFMIASACGQSTPVPTATLLPTDTPAPTETLIPTLTNTPTEVPREPAGPQAGTTLLYNDGSTLVYIPAGEYEMGGGGKNNPLHNVSLNKFWIQKTEVNRAMYAACLSVDGCVKFVDYKTSGFLNDSAYSNDPVVGVKYEQAQSYCSWIGGRLPTEAEWEYAARGTTGNTYPWGNDEPTCDLLNFNKCISKATRATNYQTDKSPFGVLDMAGNVREWVSDIFDGNYYRNSPSQSPTGPTKGNYYVVRGGGYGSPAEEVKFFYRGFEKLAGSESDLGFRCVVDDPIEYAPYCGSSSFAQSVETTRPIDHCEPTITYDPNSGCSAISETVTGGTLVSANVMTSMNYECKVIDSKHLTCTMPYASGGAISLPVTACITCAENETTAPPPLDCPINYTVAKDGNYCEYTGGAWPEYCPPNSLPLNENQCVYQQVQTGSCPIGSYFDNGMNACVTIAQTPRECSDGFNYDFDKACCKESVYAKYPVCENNEYFSSEYGCVPLPQPGGIESCVTQSMFINFCQ